MKQRFGIIAMTALMVIGLTHGLAVAADYPAKAITLICPWGAGGNVDILGRAYASAAEKILGQPVVVVNKKGAKGMLGPMAGLQAPPDGYTVNLAASAIMIQLEWEAAHGRKPPFTADDFYTIGTFVIDPTLIIVPYKSPWNSIADLIKDAKAKPDHYAFGSASRITHFAPDYFCRAAGIKARHVPFQGGAKLVAALVGNHIDFCSHLPTVAIPLAKGKKLKALAVQGEKRFKALPDVPTLKELGLDAECYNWAGLLVNKKVPMPIVEKLRQVTKQVVTGKEFTAAVEKIGTKVRYLSGQEMAELVATQSKIFSSYYKQTVK